MRKSRTPSPSSAQAVAKLLQRDRWLAWSEWAIIVAIIIADGILNRMTDIPVAVAPRNVAALLMILALWPLTAILTRITGFAKGSEAIAENVAKFLIFIAAGSILEYYAAMSAVPLSDETLLHIDQWLGFDWPVFFDWVNQHALVHKILAFCYFSLLYETGFVLFAVGIFYPRLACRFPTALIFSGLVAIFFFWIFPVAGPFVIFGHTDLPQAGYTAHYLAMRAHTLPAIPMDDIRGIVSFPSFHVSSAIIMTWFLRRFPVLFAIAAVLNAGMCAGALVIGGHYLVDVLAGIILGLTTIFVIQRLEKNWPEARLPLLRR